MHGDPDVTRAKTKQYLAANSIRLSVKNRRAPNSNTTTAYPKHLRLAYDWESYSDFVKAKILIHEVCHYNQRKHHHRWWAKYTTRPWDLVIFEVNAYLCGMAAASKMMGKPFVYSVHKKELADLPAKLRRVYFPTRVLSKSKLRRVVDKAARKAMAENVF